MSSTTIHPNLRHALDAGALPRVRGVGAQATFGPALVSVATAETDDPAYAAAQSLVATTLVQPLLEQARQDPFRTELFHGGFGEDAFAQQLDTLLADRITGRAASPIVDAVYRSLTAHRTPAPIVDTHG